MQNPFILGIAEESDFCNRKNELKDLLQYAHNGQKVVLYSARRYGKSSLIMQVLNNLSKEGFLTAYVDLFPVSSENDVVSKFATAVFKGIGRRADPRKLTTKVTNIFKRMVPTVEILPDRIEFLVKFDRSTKLELLLDDLMEGIANYVREKNLRACIALDEFQEITELPESKKIEGTLRSHIQRQKEISYLFVGSRRRTILDIFTNKNRPFYKSTFLYILKEIPKQDFALYIISKFKESKKQCSLENAEQIYDKVRGYPYYVQKLSALTWDLSDKTCNADMINRAYKMLLKIEAVDFEGIWSGLTLSQKSLLKAIAREPYASIFSKGYLERYGLSIGGAQKALKSLISRDLIEKENDIYRLTDPVMAAWLLEA